MLKRILPLALALCMLTMAGCKKEQDRLSVDKGSEPSVVSETKPVTYKNPLTGVSGISEEITRYWRIRSAIIRKKKRCSGTHRPDIRRNTPG